MTLVDSHGHSYFLVSKEYLADFIDNHRSEIVASFLGLARAEIPAAQDKDTYFLKDHLPDVLQQTANYMRSDGETRARDKSIELARKHALERAETDDYTAQQIRKEYAIVHELIFDLLGENRVLDKRAVVLFSAVSELTIAVVTEEFVKATLHRD